MRLFASIAFLGFTANTIAANSEAFEPLELNITNALIENGVDVSTMPTLADVVTRSPVRSCALVVRLPSPNTSLAYGS
jgi:hypothetical protein